MKTIAYNSKLIFIVFLACLITFVFWRPIIFIFISLVIFFTAIRIIEKYLHIDPPLTPIEDELKIEMRKAKLNFEMQYKVDKYVLDFAFPKKKIAIECDSKEFHNTEERFHKDRQKDRFLQQEGWKVLRFTGSEILGRPKHCVGEIEKLLKKD